MKVLVSCADDACGTRLVVEQTDSDGPVGAECPDCGKSFTASPGAQSTLIEAAEYGHREALETLLEKGAQPGMTDDLGRTPLHQAAYEGNLGVAKMLLERDARPNVTDNYGRTALHSAADGGLLRWGSPKAAEVLLEKGAVVDLTDDENRTPLSRAVEEAHLGVAETLLRAGAEASEIDFTGLLSSDASTEEQGRLPLHEVAAEGHSEVAAALVEQGAAAGATDDDGRTPLHVAAKKGNPEMAEVLLEKNVRPNATDEDGRTPLHMTAWNDNLKVAEVLLESGAQPEAIDENGHTPLSVAVGDENPEVAKLLVESGADVARADMEQLAAHRSPAVRAEVAAHPEAPTALIDVMVQAGSKPDLSGISEADSESLIAEERSRLREAGPYGRRLVAAHPGTPPAEVAELAEAVPEAVVQNPTAEWFDLEEPGWKQELTAKGWGALLAEPEVPKNWLREGAAQEQLFVRSRVAHHRNTPPDVLEALTDDPNAWIQGVAQRRLHKQRRAVARCLGMICRTLARVQRVVQTIQVAHRAEVPCLECMDGIPVSTGLKRDAVLQCPSCGEEEDLNGAMARSAREGRGSVVMALLMVGADPDAEGKGTRPPLQEMLIWGHREEARALLAAGADPDATDAKGIVALHRAASSGKIELVRLLLRSGGSISAIDEADQTPLHRAVRGGHLDVVEELLRAGSEVTATDSEGRTPLHRAAEQEHYDIADLLLRAGGNAESTDDRGRTPLCETARHGSPEVAELLMDTGAGIDTAARNGSTPLHLAAGSRSPEVVRVLLEAEANAYATDEDGGTPLHRAARAGSPKVAEMLLEAGAGPDASDDHGKPPLSRAVERGNSAVVRVLLERGATVSERLAVQCLAMEGGQARQAIADRPEAPEDLIELMVRAGSRPDLSDRSEKAPEPITEAERKRLREAGPYGKQLVAAHPDTPREALYELAGEAPKAFLQNPGRRLLDVEDPGWRQELSPQALAALLAEPDVPVAWLRESANHRNLLVQEAVAKNENTPPEVLRALIDENHPSRFTIPQEVAGNEATPPDVLKDLAQDDNQPVRFRARENPSFPDGDLDG